MALVQLPDGRWAEQAPIGCPACDLAWPFDGSLDRVLVGWSPDGGRNYTCQGCWFTSTPDTYRIGHAPDEGRLNAKKSPSPPNP
jgi:hypothetical protein